MQRCTAILTLLAYLIGGWALPTIHQHDDCVSGVCVDSYHSRALIESDQDHPDEDAQTCTHSDRCHRSDPSLSSTDTKSKNSGAKASGEISLQGGGAVAEHGLCAICVTRGHSAENGGTDSLANVDTLSGKSSLSPVESIHPRFGGSASPRGPPRFV